MYPPRIPINTTRSQPHPLRGPRHAVARPIVVYLVDSLRDYGLAGGTVEVCVANGGLAQSDAGVWVRREDVHDVRDVDDERVEGEGEEGEDEEGTDADMHFVSFCYESKGEVVQR